MTTADKERLSRRIPRARLLTLAAVALAVVAALSVAAYLRFDATYFQSLFVSQVETRYNVRLEFTGYEVAFWPQLGLDLTDVSLTSKEPGTVRPFITMKAARIYLRPIPLLWGRFAISQIGFEEPNLFLARGPDGELNLPKFLQADEDEEGKSKKNGSPNISGRLFLTRTKLTNGKATFVDSSKGGEPVTTQIDRFDLEMKDLAYGREPEFRLRVVTANGSRIDIGGHLGGLEPGVGFEDLDLDVKIESRDFDVAPFRPYFPESWKRRVRGGVLNSDLSISGSLAKGLNVEGDIRFDQADFGDSYRLTGTIAGEIDIRGEGGITRGNVDLRLAPGRFTKGSLEIDGETRIRLKFRSGDKQFTAEIDIDATKALYRQGDVFAKRPGTKLTLKGVLSNAKEGLQVTDAAGVLGDLRFTGSAIIREPAGPGQSTPYDLHFAPEKLDLATVSDYIEDTAPFALEGEAVFSRLDFLRRPEEAREYQVTIDASLSRISARFPMDDGRAHTLRDLEGDVAITPGLLRMPDASATVNGAPIEFRGEIEEFMAMISSDPDRRHALVDLEVWNDSIDLDRLLTPAVSAPGGRRADDTGGAFAIAQTEEEASEGAPPGSVKPVPPAGSESRVPRSRFVQRFFLKKGEIRTARAVYAKQPITELLAEFTYHEPVLALRRTEFKAAEGEWRVDGTLSLNDTTTFDLAVEVADARVELLADAFSKSDKPSRVFGIINGQGEFHGQGSDLAAWERTLRGSGEIVVRDGRLPGFNIFEVVIKALLGVFAKIVPVGRLGSLSEENAFEIFRQRFTIDRGRVWSEDIHLMTIDYELRGRGSVGLDQTLDYDTKVQLTTHGTQKMIAVASLPILDTSKTKVAPIPVRITGTLENPSIVPNASVISLGALRGLFRGLKGGVDALLKERLKGILGGGGDKRKNAREDPGASTGGEAAPEKPADEKRADPKPDLLEQGLRELDRLFGR